MRIAVASVQAPFIHGGAEILAQDLVAALRREGHHTDLVTMPFRFFPPGQVERAMEVWETEDFTSLNLYEPDVVICLKFPVYALAHPCKVAWLLHQHKHETPAIAAFDARHLATCTRFAISRHVATRLHASTGLTAEVVYPPPRDAELFHTGESLDYVFMPSRLEDSKRQSLLVRAMQHVRAPVGVLLAGSGGQQAALAALIGQLGLRDRVRLLGEVTPAELRSLYANALAVFFGPVDEDYGYVTLEAMLSRKPVITCTDSGGPLEFVEAGVTGEVVEPTPAAVAAAIDALAADRARARRLGDNGHARCRARDLRWERVLERLLSPP